MNTHYGDLQKAAQDPLLTGARVKVGFKITRRVHSLQLDRLSLEHEASIRNAGGKIFLERTRQRYSGGVTLTEARAVRLALYDQKCYEEWGAFKERPLSKYLGHVAKLAKEHQFPTDIPAQGGRFFAERFGRYTLIRCGITGWPKKPSYPVQQLTLERAATLSAPDEMPLPDLLDNDNITLRIARFPESVTPDDLEPIVSSLNASNEKVRVAVNLLPLGFVAFIGI